MGTHSLALELEKQQVTGQLFKQEIAEQAFAVETLSREDIAQLPVQNIADLLEWVGGVDVRQRGGFTHKRMSAFVVQATSKP